MSGLWTTCPMVNRRMDKDDLDSIVWSIIFNRRWASNKNGELWEWCRACHGNVAKENLGHSYCARSSIQKLESVSRLGRAGPDFGDPTKRKCFLPLLISKRRHVSVLTQIPSIHLSTFWYMSSKSGFVLVEQDDSTRFIWEVTGICAALAMSWTFKR